MLVLTRREGERFSIGDDVEIEVLEIKPGVVRVGIRAPRTVRVMRSELVAAVAASNRQAAADLESVAVRAAALKPTPTPVQRT